MVPSLRARLSVAALVAALAGPALAQPGLRAPPPPTGVDAAPPPPAPDAAPAPSPAEAPPPPPPPAGADPGRDQLFMDAALESLLLGDLYRAEGLFRRLAEEGSTPEARITASMLADRVRALAARRAQLMPRGLAGRRTPVRPRKPEAARPFFVLTTTVAGLGLWGWTVPLALGVDPDQSPRLMLGLYMSTAAAAFVVPYALTSKRDVSWGQTNLAFYGATRGLEYGLLVSNLMFGVDGGRFGDDDPQAFAASLALGSVTGLVGGTLWAGGARMTPGQARTLAVGADYGLFSGFVFGHLLGWDELQDSNGGSRLDARARMMSAAGLGGTLLGIGSGRALALARDNTWGDGEVMRGAGLLGALAGVTNAALFDYLDSSRATLGTMAIGSGLGLWMGDALVRNTDFPVGSAVLLDLALLAGGLGAAGLTYLVYSGGDEGTYFLAATLGAAGAGGFTYYALRDERAPPARAGQPAGWALLPRFTPGRAGHGGLTLLGSF
jgi:hypothetical protein